MMNIESTDSSADLKTILVMHPISWTDLKRVISLLPPTYAKRGTRPDPKLGSMRYVQAILTHEKGRGYWIWCFNVFREDCKTCLLSIWPPGEWTPNQPNVRTWIVTQDGVERRYGKLESVVNDLRRLCGGTPIQIDLRFIYPKSLGDDDEKA